MVHLSSASMHFFPYEFISFCAPNEESCVTLGKSVGRYGPFSLRQFFYYYDRKGVMAPKFAGYNEHFKVLIVKILSYWWRAGFGKSAHFPVGLKHGINLTFITPPSPPNTLPKCFWLQTFPAHYLRERKRIMLSHHKHCLQCPPCQNKL